MRRWGATWASGGHRAPATSAPEASCRTSTSCAEACRTTSTSRQTTTTSPRTRATPARSRLRTSPRPSRPAPFTTPTSSRSTPSSIPVSPIYSSLVLSTLLRNTSLFNNQLIEFQNLSIRTQNWGTSWINRNFSKCKSYIKQLLLCLISFERDSIDSRFTIISKLFLYRNKMKSFVKTIIYDIENSNLSWYEQTSGMLNEW